MLAISIYSRKTIVTIIVIFWAAFVTKAQLVFDKSQYQVDNSLHLIICNRLPAQILTKVSTVSFDRIYTFSSAINTITFGIPYEISVSGNTYKLYFTRLPLVNIRTTGDIGDEYVGSTITVADTIGDLINSNAGVKLRGNYSRTFPKKSYHVQLWADSTGKSTQEKAILGMRSDQTWLLLAMYNEKLRLNNKVSHDLWLKLHKLYYADSEPDANSTIRSKYVEVFLNNKYQGVYLFTEDLDRKQLKIKKQTVSSIGGELYKGENWDQSTLFSGVPDLPATSTTTWGGWDLTYPDTTNWVNLHRFTDFAVGASDSLFKQQISTKLRQDNFADYFIFLNLLRAEDNTGKNLFLARYNKDEPYFIAPWDLDGTWGYYWDGNSKNITNDILSNGLFNRLLSVTGNFKSQLATRWFSLRGTILSIDSLNKAFTTNHNFLVANGVYERENMKWAGGLLSYSFDELDYIQNWTKERVSYLDDYFKNLVYKKAITYSFNAHAFGQAAVLDWSANCFAISSFDVQSSSDSLAWNALNSYPIIANDSLSCQYTFTDGSPSVGASYYRLKITDKQNNVSYSSIQQLNFDLPKYAVNLFPNPASTTLQVQGNIDKVNVYSLRGAFIYASDSSSPNTVDVKNWPTGMYMVRVTEKSGAVSTHKILVYRDQ